jgi:Delta6-protoilludene synthase
MYEYDVDLTEALLRLKAYSDAIVARFLDCVNAIDALSFGEVLDAKLKAYVNALGYWIRGWDDWSFEGGRYFEDGEAVRRSGKLTLRPPKPTATPHT